MLRCDDLGANLETVARGLRNPWDITFDSGFNWLVTDNDQNEGDRNFMPFFGARFGWGHGWSADWIGANHPSTVPITLRSRILGMAALAKNTSIASNPNSACRFFHGGASERGSLSIPDVKLNLHHFTDFFHDRHKK